MSLSNDLENKLLDHIRGGTAYSQPSGIYVKLHTGSPGEDCTENTAANTVRDQVTFGAASGGSIASNALVEWTSVSDSETYSSISLWDDSTAGNPLGYGDLSSTVAVTAGDTFQITTGNLTWTLD